MDTLFPLEIYRPEGFQYYDTFISEKEEQEILHEITKIELRPLNFQGYEAKLKVASFGYDWNFTSRSLTRGNEVPKLFFPIIKKVAQHLSLKPDDFVEVLLTEYSEKSVINWHRDAPPFDLIAGISLLSDCTFRFRPYDKKKQGRSSIISLPVRRRSLYIIHGPSRIEWEHSIMPVKHIRYSITLRTLK